MRASSLAELPEPGTRGAQLCYEPKWDGFRALLFCGEQRVCLQSRAGKLLSPYFPDLPGPAPSIAEVPAGLR